MTLINQAGHGYHEYSHGREFVYMVAAVGWFSRRVLVWLSIAPEVTSCIETVEEALARYGRSQILHTDQSY